jgi:hypothetical protein
VVEWESVHLVCQPLLGLLCQLQMTWVWSSHWNENWQFKSKYFEKTCPIATLSMNPTWPDLELNPGCHGGKLVT